MNKLKEINYSKGEDAIQFAGMLQKKKLTKSLLFEILRVRLNSQGICDRIYDT